MENYLGEIRIFAGSFAPVDWLFCNGQMLNISEYEALYTLLGVTYGGDGQTTFAVPNLQSRVAVGFGQGGGLSNYPLGAALGVEGVTLTTPQMAPHQHPLQGNVKAMTGGTGQTAAAGAMYGDQGGDTYSNTAGTSALASDAMSLQVGVAGGNQPHANLQPTLAIRYIIATQGIYPSQP